MPNPNTDNKKSLELIAGAPMEKRMSARAALENLARDKHREAYGIEKLLDALPAKLPIEADEALAGLVERARR